MLLFKDIKQNYPVYILDTQEFSLIQGKATQVSFPRLEMNQKTGKTEMVVDVTIEANGKMATYAIPESHSVTYAGHLVLSTEKSGLTSEVEAQKANAEQVLASASKAQNIIDKAPSLLAELNPMYKEKQETEQRFGKIEGSIGEMKELITDALAERVSKMMVNANGQQHSWTASQVKKSMESLGLSIPSHVTHGDAAYLANMYYADLYPDPLKDEASCLRAAYKVANDPDGYEGMIFCRWTADAIGKAIKLDWKKFV